PSGFSYATEFNPTTSNPVAPGVTSVAFAFIAAPTGCDLALLSPTNQVFSSTPASIQRQKTSW
ncbi:unnamed protein product, partial [Closterium sp. NIES-54]